MRAYVAQSSYTATLYSASRFDYCRWCCGGAEESVFMRVVVTGGRNFSDSDLVAASLGAVHRKHGVSVLIQGGAKGADRLCAEWAERLGIEVAPYPADWNTYGKGAGPIRNQQMIDDGKPDVALAFAGGRGTSDMVRRLEKAGIPVWNLST